MTERIDAALAEAEAAAKVLRTEARKIGERLQHLSARKQPLTAEEGAELQRLRSTLAEAQSQLAEVVAAMDAWTSYGNEGGANSAGGA
jgi:hypothetical protein